MRKTAYTVQIKDTVYAVLIPEYVRDAKLDFAFIIDWLFL